MHNARQTIEMEIWWRANAEFHRKRNWMRRFPQKYEDLWRWHKKTIATMSSVGIVMCVSRDAGKHTLEKQWTESNVVSAFSSQTAFEIIRWNVLQIEANELWRWLILKWHIARAFASFAQLIPVDGRKSWRYHSSNNQEIFFIRLSKLLKCWSGFIHWNTEVFWNV